MGQVPSRALKGFCCAPSLPWEGIHDCVCSTFPWPAWPWQGLFYKAYRPCHGRGAALCLHKETKLGAGEGQVGAGQDGSLGLSPSPVCVFSHINSQFSTCQWTLIRCPPI